MKHKKSFGVVLIIVALLSVSFICALTASISSPRVVLYGNMTNKDILILENSVGVNNDNEGDVSITITPLGDWADRVEILESEFVLSAGEKKEVSYTITIDKAGAYQGDILVSFEEESSKNKLSAAQELVVLVKDKNGVVPYENDSTNNNLIFGVLGFVLAGVLLSGLFILNKSNKLKK
ncbi:MAG: hypothetical protein U9Q06_03305 [Nanoarchaeota archaeon]|nr:hypothetical protein [Nanoarchaeota archaeon]